LLPVQQQIRQVQQQIREMTCASKGLPPARAALRVSPSGWRPNVAQLGSSTQLWHIQVVALVVLGRVPGAWVAHQPVPRQGGVSGREVDGNGRFVRVGHGPGGAVSVAALRPGQLPTLSLSGVGCVSLARGFAGNCIHSQRSRSGRAFRRHARRRKARVRSHPRRSRACVGTGSGMAAPMVKTSAAARAAAANTPDVPVAARPQNPAQQQAASAARDQPDPPR